jgi:cation/acetate symporter
VSKFYTLLIGSLLPLLSSPAFAVGAIEGGERQATNPTAIALFVVFVIATLGISYWASKKTTSSSTFYNAGGNISGVQNGIAIAGDFMSASSFLGITGLMFVFGYDGLVFAIGAFAGWPLMLFLFAKRVRNLGSYTFTDVVSMRLERTKTRIVAIMGTVTVVILYLIAQMVGAGKLIELLFGLPYEVAIITVTLLVLAYVTFGGMLATTWVQIIKAGLLVFGATVMTWLILAMADFDLAAIFNGVAEVHPKQSAALAPGGMFDDPIQVTTIMISMMFGTLGLPHVLMRLFTVPTTHEAKKSAFYASAIMGYFYLLMIIIGFGSVYVLYQYPEMFTDAGKLPGGSNMIAIHLANALGGDLLMGFMSAVAFATILAVVAGLTVSGAAAISHDLYAEVLCEGNPDPDKELKLTRITTVVIGLIALGLGILFQNENVGLIGTMPMVVAASVNFPILFLSLYWSGMTTRGAIYCALTGLLASVGLTIIGPQVWVSVLGFEEALFPYDYPALFTLPAALAAAWLFSVTDKSERGRIDREQYYTLLPKSELGGTTPLSVSKH